MSKLKTVCAILRDMKGLSQVGLANEIMMSQQTVSLAERGGKVSESVLTSIAITLGWDGTIADLQKPCTELNLNISEDENEGFNSL